jgi:hypothetical protein
MPATRPALTAKLDRVEDGFARVINADTGKTMGYVYREKHGSTRTGTRWTATRTNSRNPTVLGYGDTRADAVSVIIAHAQRFA